MAEAVSPEPIAYQKTPCSLGLLPKTRLRSTMAARGALWLRRTVFGRAHLSECTRTDERGNTIITIAQRFPQDFFRMLAQKRRGHGVDGRGQPHIQRCLDVRSRACSGVWDQAQSTSFASLRCVESLLDCSQVTDRYVGFLHLCHPVLQLVAGKDSSNDSTQLLLIGCPCLAVGEMRVGDEIGPLEHFRDQASI